MAGADAGGDPALRALRADADFDTYWTWHEKQEFARNHQARYRDHLTLAA
ncbi:MULTISPECIES: hypothetical protein [Kitasatospora]|uniref:Uncharacterized protein n=1 Tax=Kitasatospora cystarginea TaxID=58350 RepID=A0ABN3DK57_9ACTN